MARTTRQQPRTGELWLSRPPYLLVARILDVDLRDAPGIVSYELVDEDGSVLHRQMHARLDAGWWQTFQLMTPRYG